MSKIVFLTSDSLRHKYIAHQLSNSFDLKLIITEKKSLKIEDTTELIEEEAIFTKNHFQARLESEYSFFGEYNGFPNGVNRVDLEHGLINSQEVYKMISSFKPDRIILFGTSIIKGSLLEKYENKIINLHLGLSPYYKGSATNLFPIAYNELSCIGATIHVANAKVDQGPVLHQLRPLCELSDSLHDLGNKVIYQAGKDLGSVIQHHIDDAFIGAIQTKKGKVFRLKDVTVLLLRQAYLNIEKGIVSDYLKKKDEIDEKYPIITLL